MNKVIFVSNRRFAHRHNLVIDMRFQVLHSSVPEQRVESLNISTNGVYFATQFAIKEGAVVQLLMKMPPEITGKPCSEWRCTGHVVRVRPICSPRGPVGVGVLFDCYEILPEAALLAS
ncbi:MAG TPA: PilZ domain-containing protein [Candidatus Dormibacteraeota bacterium]|nr:PilZ domain-containing protein [Candidatus Dormibacteraeota bacterium]